MVFLSPSKLKWARSVGAFDVETLSAFGTGVANGRKATNSRKCSDPPHRPSACHASPPLAWTAAARCSCTAVRFGCIAVSELPALEEVDCATVKRGADAYVEEEDSAADDIMAVRSAVTTLSQPCDSLTPTIVSARSRALPLASQEILEEERKAREEREAALAAEAGTEAPKDTGTKKKKCESRSARTGRDAARAAAQPVMPCVGAPGRRCRSLRSSRRRSRSASRWTCCAARGATSR